MWQGGLWGGLSDPRNFTKLCEALALRDQESSPWEAGERRAGPGVAMSGVGSLARSGGTSGTAGPVEMVGAGVCWPRGALPGRVPRRGAGVCVQPQSGSHH